MSCWIQIADGRNTISNLHLVRVGSFVGKDERTITKMNVQTLISILRLLFAFGPVLRFHCPNIKRRNVWLSDYGLIVEANKKQSPNFSINLNDCANRSMIMSGRSRLHVKACYRSISNSLTSHLIFQSIVVNCIHAAKQSFKTNMKRLFIFFNLKINLKNWT